jgi:hypothetical protein
MNQPATTPPKEQQQPLGDRPSYDDVLDVAVQYTFPCSDPISCDTCCADVDERMQREEGEPQGPGMTPGHGEPVTQSALDVSPAPAALRRSR